MRGRFSFSLDEIPEDIYSSRSSLTTMAHRLKNQDYLFSPYKKFYTIITPQYKKVCSIPVLLYIDDLMKHIGVPYYVSFLSATNLHCTDKHPSQTLHIITTKSLPSISRDSIQISFSRKKKINDSLLKQIEVPTGYFNISSPALTAFDLVKYIATSGSLNQIAATILRLAARITELDLRDVLIEEGGGTSTAQRLGYLLELFGYEELANVIERWLKNKNTVYIVMMPYVVTEIKRKTKPLAFLNKNTRWKVITPIMD